ncbi:MAG: hypothetical protein RIS76_1418 [Verrucomicrobiota bacterium]
MPPVVSRVRRPVWTTGPSAFAGGEPTTRGIERDLAALTPLRYRDLWRRMLRYLLICGVLHPQRSRMRYEIPALQAGASV